MTTAQLREACLALLDGRQALDETSPATLDRVFAKATLRNCAEQVARGLRQLDDMVYVLDGRHRFAIDDAGELAVERVSTARIGGAA